MFLLHTSFCSTKCLSLRFVSTMSQLTASALAQETFERLTDPDGIEAPTLTPHLTSSSNEITGETYRTYSDIHTVLN